MNIKKNDTVLVIAGKDKGKTGKVVAAMPKANKIAVEGINIQKKHKKPRSANSVGGIMDQIGAIDVSNVLVVCDKCKKATRVGHKIEGDNKFRICKKCGASLDVAVKDTAEDKKKKKAADAEKKAVKAETEKKVVKVETEKKAVKAEPEKKAVEAETEKKAEAKIAEPKKTVSKKAAVKAETETTVKKSAAKKAKVESEDGEPAKKKTTKSPSKAE